ncbi:glycosyltransferase family 2 protein [Butyrivibrio sp. AC2005]|uniref:glycosyltransferase family 2 protein n=1 Tax=Butyrivibrio sp. AC2005 TaxID=1280672 RepID=UPI0004115AEA|nr:glycosyltransferase family A protein [Butyrivibrio sp. AC2005]
MAEVSVVMSIYNDEEYLSDSIDSILNQSFTDFEFIIVVEFGSSAESVKLVEEYASKDKRVVPIFNDTKLGISASVNRGMRMAVGKYIARMDGDDISGINRLAYQKRFLDYYDNIGVLGTRHTVIDSPKWRVDFFADPNLNYSELLFFLPLRQPTIMIRKRILDEFNLYYNEQLLGVEDYDFFIRAGDCTELSNLMDDELFQYRRAAGNKSEIDREHDEAVRAELARSLYERKFGRQYLDDELKTLMFTTQFDNLDRNQFGNSMEKLNLLITEMYRINMERKIYDINCIEKTFCHRWLFAKHAMELRCKGSVPEYAKEVFRNGLFYRKWME